MTEQTDGVDNGSLTCEKGHHWPIIDGIPSLLFPDLTDEDKKWIEEYDQMAEGYDEAVKQYNEWLDIDINKERQGFTQFIPIEGPSKIIDVSIGTAANFEALESAFKGKMGRFNLHGLDVSWGMLHVAQRKAGKLGLTINLVHGSVFNIPYPDNTFDIVLHTGGINTFSDISGALEEMLRIVKKDGFVIVIDEGVSPRLRGTDRGQEIIKANSLFAAKPPLEYLPERAKEVEVTYVMNDTFYQIVFRK
ncbi:MAG: class I SAM-dependent methyltransferase [Candidatus Thorarchaeota archaeon]